MSRVSEVSETQREVLTFLQLVVAGSFQVIGFNQGRLMQYQCVAHAVDVDSLSRQPDAQFWHAQHRSNKPSNNTDRSAQHG